MGNTASATSAASSAMSHIPHASHARLPRTPPSSSVTHVASSSSAAPRAAAAPDHLARAPLEAGRAATALASKRLRKDAAGGAAQKRRFSAPIGPAGGIGPVTRDANGRWMSLRKDGGGGPGMGGKGEAENQAAKADEIQGAGGKAVEGGVRGKEGVDGSGEARAAASASAAGSASPTTESPAAGATGVRKRPGLRMSPRPSTRLQSFGSEEEEEEGRRDGVGAGGAKPFKLAWLSRAREEGRGEEGVLGEAVELGDGGRVGDTVEGNEERRGERRRGERPPGRTWAWEKKKGEGKGKGLGEGTTGLKVGRKAVVRELGKNVGKGTKFAKGVSGGVGKGAGKGVGRSIGATKALKDMKPGRPGMGTDVGTDVPAYRAVDGAMKPIHDTVEANAKTARKQEDAKGKFAAVGKEKMPGTGGRKLGSPKSIGRSRSFPSKPPRVESPTAMLMREESLARRIIEEVVEGEVPPWFHCMCQSWLKLKEEFPGREGFTEAELAGPAKFYRFLVCGYDDLNRKWKYNALRSLREVAGAFSKREDETWALAPYLRSIGDPLNVMWSLPSKSQLVAQKLAQSPRNGASEFRPATNQVSPKARKDRLLYPGKQEKETIVEEDEKPKVPTVPMDRIYKRKDGKEVPPTWRDTAILAYRGLEELHPGSKSFTMAQLTIYVEMNWDRICWSHHARPQWRTILRQEIRTATFRGVRCFEESDEPGSLPDSWTMTSNLMKNLPGEYIVSSRPLGGSGAMGPAKRAKRRPSCLSGSSAAKRKQRNSGGWTTDDDSDVEDSMDDVSGGEIKEEHAPVSHHARGSSDAADVTSPFAGNTAQKERFIPPKLRKRLREVVFDGGEDGGEMGEPPAVVTCSASLANPPFSPIDDLLMVVDAGFLPSSAVVDRREGMSSTARAVASYARSPDFKLLQEKIAQNGTDDLDAQVRFGMLDASLTRYIREFYNKGSEEPRYMECKRVVDGFCQLNPHLSEDVLVFATASLAGWSAAIGGYRSWS